MATNRPVCKYGGSCYRKNPQHLRAYFHPNSINEENEVCMDCMIMHALSGTFIRSQNHEGVGKPAVGMGYSVVFLKVVNHDETCSENFSLFIDSPDPLVIGEGYGGTRDHTFQFHH